MSDGGVPTQAANASAASPKSWRKLLQATGQDWLEDKAARLAAAVAFYAIFSLAPLLVVALAVASAFFDADQVARELHSQLTSQFGAQGAATIQDMLRASQRPREGVSATMIGLAVLLWGATGLFSQLQDAFNTIWEVRPRPGRGVWATIRSRLFSGVMVLATGLLLLASLFLSTVLNTVNVWLAGAGEGAGWLTQLLHEGGALVLMTCLFALIFKYMPDAEIAWRDVGIGAAATAALFVAGKWVLGIYLGSSSYSSVFGPAASLVVILVWIYYSAQILFLGAEFTQAYARMYGSRVIPSAGAERVEACERREQGLD